MQGADKQQIRPCSALQAQLPLRHSAPATAPRPPTSQPLRHTAPAFVPRGDHFQPQGGPLAGDRECNQRASYAGPYPGSLPARSGGTAQGSGGGAGVIRGQGISIRLPQRGSAPSVSCEHLALLCTAATLVDAYRRLERCCAGAIRKATPQMLSCHSCKQPCKAVVSCSIKLFFRRTTFLSRCLCCYALQRRKLAPRGAPTPRPSSRRWRPGSTGQRRTT